MLSPHTARRFRMPCRQQRLRRTILAIFLSPITLCLVPGCFSVLEVRGRSRGTSTGETNPEVSGREQSRRRLGVSPRFIIPQTLHGCRKLLRVGPLDNLLNLLLG